jgi:hypothetical protein
MARSCRRVRRRAPLPAPSRALTREVQVDVGERANRDRPPAQPEAAATHEMAEHRDRQPHPRPWA